MTFMVTKPLWLLKGRIKGKNITLMVKIPYWQSKGRIEGKHMTLMVTLLLLLFKGRIEGKHLTQMVKLLLRLHGRLEYDLYGLNISLAVKRSHKRSCSHYFLVC